ncbi:lipopolysaccharide biosynthesis protein [Wenyingzhuangia sp. IMCC45533]
MIWTFMELFSKQIIGFLVSVVLARLLLPEEFGIIGMLSIFMAVGRTLINSGLATSLIRTPDANQEDFSTVFFFNLLGSIIIYFVLFLASPLIADFFGQSILISITRVYGLIFIIDAFSTVQKTRLTQQLNFKTQMRVALPSLIGGSLVGVLLAYKGYGVWSLVWMYLLQSVLSSVQLWIVTRWSPSFIFNYEKFKYHFNFGYKLLLSGLLNALFSNSYTLIIGKFFLPAQLGYYTRANSVVQLPVNNISKALSKVTYPMFASIKDDDVRLKKVYQKILKMVTFVIAPILVFLAVLATPTFRFLFTEKWLPAVPYFQVLCVSGILYPFHSYNLNILNVKGRSDLFLKLELYKKIIDVITIASAIPFGVMGLLWGRVISSLLGLFINTYYSGRFINYTGLEQLKDVLHILFVTIFAGIVILCLDNFLIGNQVLDLLRILIGMSVGLIVYLLLSYSFKISSFDDLKKIILKR